MCMAVECGVFMGSFAASTKAQKVCVTKVFQ